MPIKTQLDHVAGIAEHLEKGRCGGREPCKKMLREPHFELGTPKA